MGGKFGVLGCNYLRPHNQIPMITTDHTNDRRDEPPRFVAEPAVAVRTRLDCHLEGSLIGFAAAHCSRPHGDVPTRLRVYIPDTEGYVEVFGTVNPDFRLGRGHEQLPHARTKRGDNEGVRR